MVVDRVVVKVFGWYKRISYGEHLIFFCIFILFCRTSLHFGGPTQIKSSILFVNAKKLESGSLLLKETTRAKLKQSAGELAYLTKTKARKVCPTLVGNLMT